MSQNGTTVQNQSSPSIIRPLVILDSRTVQRFYSPLRHLLFGFEAQGITCCVVVPPESQIESFLWPGIEIVRYPALRFGLFYRQNRRRLILQIEEFKPTIIHCFGTAKSLLAKSLGRTLGIPVVLTVSSSQQSFLKRQIISRGVSAVIAPSEHIAESLKKRIPRIAAIIRQVNIGTFVDETCACFSRPDRIPGMVVVSDFLRFDDLEPFLSAVRHLAVNGYEFHVVLMGDGSAQGDVRKFIQGVGLVSIVNISPPMGPLRAVFRGADIFVHPFIAQRFDPAMLEAASAGSAIATDKNNADYFLQNNTTAVFFDSRDELSIYSALQKLLDDREFAKSIASAAQNYLRGNNTVSSMVDNLLKIYSRAASSANS
jgi:glycosyltransferase involved in cell wall biosynthesis